MNYVPLCALHDFCESVGIHAVIQSRRRLWAKVAETFIVCKRSGFWPQTCACFLWRWACVLLFVRVLCRSDRRWSSCRWSRECAPWAGVDCRFASGLPLHFDARAWTWNARLQLHTTTNRVWSDSTAASAWVVGSYLQFRHERVVVNRLVCAMSQSLRSWEWQYFVAAHGREVEGRSITLLPADYSRQAASPASHLHTAHTLCTSAVYTLVNLKFTYWRAACGHGPLEQGWKQYVWDCFWAAHSRQVHWPVETQKQAILDLMSSQWQPRHFQLGDSMAGDHVDPFLVIAFLHSTECQQIFSLVKSKPHAFPQIHFVKADTISSSPGVCDATIHFALRK